MKKLPVTFVLLVLVLFFTTGFEFFGFKKKSSKQEVPEKKVDEVAKSQVVSVAVEKEEGAAKMPTLTEEAPMLNQETESIIEFTPEGEERPGGPEGRQLTEEQLEKAKKLKKQAEKIQKDIRMIKDVQTAMDTRNMTATLAGLPKNTGVITAASAASVPVVPAGVSVAGSGTVPAGLSPGLQSAIEAAQRAQNLQTTLEKIKAEQERIKREQERIREEKLRLESQTTSPVTVSSQKNAT